MFAIAIEYPGRGESLISWEAAKGGDVATPARDRDQALKFTCRPEAELWAEAHLAPAGVGHVRVVDLGGGSQWEGSAPAAPVGDNGHAGPVGPAPGGW